VWLSLYLTVMKKHNLRTIVFKALMNARVLSLTCFQFYVHRILTSFSISKFLTIFFSILNLARYLTWQRYFFFFYRLERLFIFPRTVFLWQREVIRMFCKGKDVYKNDWLKRRWGEGRGWVIFIILFYG
jgi:hypothetical protein